MGIDVEWMRLKTAKIDALEKHLKQCGVIGSTRGPQRVKRDLQDIRDTLWMLWRELKNERADEAN